MRGLYKNFSLSGLLSPLVPYSFSRLPSYACQVLGKLLLAAPLRQRPPNGGSRFESNLDGRIFMPTRQLVFLLGLQCSLYSNFTVLTCRLCSASIYSALEEAIGNLHFVKFVVQDQCIIVQLLFVGLRYSVQHIFIQLFQFFHFPYALGHRGTGAVLVQVLASERKKKKSSIKMIFEYSIFSSWLLAKIQRVSFRSLQNTEGL